MLNLTTSNQSAYSNTNLNNFNTNTTPVLSYNQFNSFTPNEHQCSYTQTQSYSGQKYYDLSNGTHYIYYNNNQQY